MSNKVYPKMEEIENSMFKYMEENTEYRCGVMNWYSEYGLRQHEECEKMYNNREYWYEGGKQINKLNGKTGLVACFYILCNFTPFKGKYKTMVGLEGKWNGLTDSQGFVWGKYP